ncbi:MAG: glycosyltransferase, partial [Promicromonosporaceae bacterium]|nr:glycosyltransferase [Promicromonosporaceae bacterium]
MIVSTPPNPVTAVLVTRGASAFLPQTLAALRAQTVPPHRVLLVNAGERLRRDALPPDETAGLAFEVIEAPGARTFGQAITVGLAEAGLPSDDAGWLWLLHDDSAPAPDALAGLLRRVEHSQNVAIAGCKQRRWTLDSAGRPKDPFAEEGWLIEVGHTVSPLGRRLTGIDDTEIDQGQHDGRDDVLAVGLAGALVRAAVWQELRGTDPELGAFGDGTDLCRRAWRAGHRVIVVPESLIKHGQASLLGLATRGRRGTRPASPPPVEHRPVEDGPAEATALVPAAPPRAVAFGEAPGEEASYTARRRAQLHHRLVHCSGWLLPLAWLAMVLWAPLSALGRLALKETGQARGEIVAALRGAVRLLPLARARRNLARTSTVPRRTLNPLLASWRQVHDQRRDLRLARREANRTRFGPSDVDRQERRLLAGPRRMALTLTLLGAAGVALAAFGPWLGTLLAGGRVVGGALLPAPGSLADVWQAATSGWNLGALGSAAPADPLALVLLVPTALAGGLLQAAVNLLLLLAVPLAALAAWFAAGALTRVNWARALAALTWAALPSFLLALGTGRLGAVIAHCTLPWVALAWMRATGSHATDQPDERPARGSLTATAATGLLLAVAVAGAPLLAPVAVLAVIVGMGVSSARLRLPLVLLPTLAVGAPFWWRWLRNLTDPTLRDGPAGWRALLADPLALPWQASAGHLPLEAADPLVGPALLLGQPAV